MCEIPDMSLGTKLGFSARAGHAFNHRAISPALHVSLLEYFRMYMLTSKAFWNADHLHAQDDLNEVIPRD